MEKIDLNNLDNNYLKNSENRNTDYGFKDLDIVVDLDEEIHWKAFVKGFVWGLIVSSIAICIVSASI